MIRKILISSAVALPLVFAQDAKTFELPEKIPFGEVSANVNMVTSYIWRGEVQNGNNVAIQGGFDWSADLVDTYVSAYVGTWGSPAANSDGNLELDYYGGFSGAVPGLEDYLSYDGGILYYDYPGLTTQSPANDFIEYYGSIAVAVPFYDIGLSYYYGYSPTGYGGNYDYDYQNIGVEVPVPGTPFTGFASIGFTGADEAGKENFTDYIGGIGFSLFGLDHSLYFSGTEGYSSDDKDGVSGGGNHFVYTLGASF